MRYLPPTFPRYAPVRLTAGAREALRARVDRGEIVVDPRANDPIQRAWGGRTVLGVSEERRRIVEQFTAADAYCFSPDAYGPTLDDRAHEHGWWWSGLPAPDMAVECECGCGCQFIGRFDEVVWVDDILRCGPCIGAGHPPVLRLEHEPWVAPDGP